MCPWSLALASRMSVLARADLGLGFFFCVLGLGFGLEPCVLDYTSVEYSIKPLESRQSNIIINLILACKAIIPESCMKKKACCYFLDEKKFNIV